MKNTLRTTALALALGLFGLVGTAQAQQAPHPAAPQAQQVQAHEAHENQAPRAPAMRTPAQTKAALIDAAQRSNMPHYVAPNGKVIYNAHAPEHVAVLEPLSTPGSGILQIMLIDGVQHTMGHFEGQYIHFQYANGTNNWRMRPWANGLRVGNKRMFGALIQLSPEEASNLRTRIAGIYAEEGPENLAGANWANGRIKDSVGVPYFNCASSWCSMPVGGKGESIAHVIGIPSTGDPFTLQRTLETSGNEKIIGIGLFGPKEPNLGQNPNQRFAR